MTHERVLAIHDDNAMRKLRRRNCFQTIGILGYPCQFPSLCLHIFFYDFQRRKFWTCLIEGSVGKSSKVGPSAHLLEIYWVYETQYVKKEVTSLEIIKHMPL